MPRNATMTTTTSVKVTITTATATAATSWWFGWLVGVPFLSVFKRTMNMTHGWLMLVRYLFVYGFEWALMVKEGIKAVLRESRWAGEHEEDNRRTTGGDALCFASRV